MTSWRERIQAARERGCFTGEDRIMASGWMTCAVGEQHAAMPSVVVFQHPGTALAYPVDDTLEELGCGSGFDSAVNDDDFAKADRLLDLIEDRALELKRGA